MPYTPNVPQANQTIASTQQPIEANFQFVQTDARVEHAFNGVPGGQAEGTHLRASMPNQADPSSLPAGTNGMYYVAGGLPKFYDGTNAYFLQIGIQRQFTQSGSTSSLSTSTGPILTFPARSAGSFFVYYPPGVTVSGHPGRIPAAAAGQFVTTTNNYYAQDLLSPDISITGNNTDTLILQGSVDHSSEAGVYSYVLNYVTL